jgi:hypothetical protein
MFPFHTEDATSYICQDMHGGGTAVLTSRALSPCHSNRGVIGHLNFQIKGKAEEIVAENLIYSKGY